MRSKFNTIEEVLDFAIKQEIESYSFYLKLADFVEQPEMAKVLTDLASEELRHKLKLEAVRAEKITLDKEEINNLGIAESVNDIEPDAKMDYLELLIVGMKREEQTRRLYTNLASISLDRDIRDMFIQLAHEEAGHKLRFEIEYELMTF
jgi:rubrerythrin